MRIGTRRFTRLTNAFSKKAVIHFHMLSLYFLHYNFVRIHKTLHMTPAMAAGLSAELRDLEWIVGLLDTRAAKPNRPKLTAREFQNEALPNRLPVTGRAQGLGDT